MSTFRYARFGAALLASAPLAAHAAAEPPPTPAELQQLRDELRALKSDYEARLHALEERLEHAESSRQAVAEAAPAPAVATASAPSGAAFNPKISLILDGGYADYSRSHREPDVAGFLLGDETDPRPSGLSLGETELAVEANVDQSFHAWTTLSVAPEGGIGVEEAYINTLDLPDGFSVKFGRFFSDIGYQNHQHAHAWEFVDAPLVYRAMLGTQLGDDGVQLRWLAPTDTFFEVGTELLRGASFPAGGDGRNGIKAITGFAHLGGDAGLDGSWRLGLSHLRADANRRPTGDEDEPALTFDGKSDLTILDGVYKWAPNGNATVRNAVLQGEYFFRHEHGELVADPDGSADLSRYRGDQQGFYVQGVYQFMPRWRVGLRYDRLFADNDVANAVPDSALDRLADDGHDPQRWSLMTDFSNSEFSRFRLQLSRDVSRPNHIEDDQVFLQYILSLGPHPAHQF
ncbi:hypothetical protein DFR24_2939 [Panacagrimonas perspica]|uniref:Phosphate-selective porin O/P n=1 Tax=Panacagrimonas perspica TaxID=381431 RepID=A0A4S3K9D4_9GAMM|nr:hypothetical protein [Panacagrimonas perspica]TDU28565.1 hypothetical protein DFR24_2939 [Panacagrimonas perspica]THD04900.1 hypothetical protein B1810_02835 [Panacagrimonas perspica]